MGFLKLLITAWIACFEAAGEACCDLEEMECRDFNQTDCTGYYKGEEMNGINTACEWNGKACTKRITCGGATNESICIDIGYYDLVQCDWYNGSCKYSKLCGEYDSQKSCEASSNCSWTNNECQTRSCENRRTEWECLGFYNDCEWNWNDGVCKNLTCGNYYSETDCNKLYEDCEWIEDGVQIGQGSCKTRSCGNYYSAYTCNGVQIRGGYCRMSEDGACERTTSCGDWTGRGRSDCESKVFDLDDDSHIYCGYMKDGTCVRATSCGVWTGTEQSNCERHSFHNGFCRYTNDEACELATSCGDWTTRGKSVCELKYFYDGNGFSIYCHYASDGLCRSATCDDYVNNITYCRSSGCKYSVSLGTCTAVSACSDWSREGAEECRRHRYNGKSCTYDDTDGTCFPYLPCSSLTSVSECDSGEDCSYLNRESCATCPFFCSIDGGCPSFCSDSDSESDADSDSDSDADAKAADSALTSAVSSFFSALSAALLLLLLSGFLL